MFSVPKKVNGVMLAALMSAVVLAGCVEGDEAAAPVDNVDPDEYVLEAGKGAVSGLLIDDRFRPIQLTPKAETEFQFEGFILVQETGAQLATTENGEFSIVDLEPGKYTLRLQAEGLEATPMKVDVDEGVWNEATFSARRVNSIGNEILTQEHAAFASCFTNFVWLSVTLDCTSDLSGDTDRAAWYPNMEPYNASRYIIVEALFDKDAPPSTAFDVVAREGSIGTDYSGFVLTDSDGRYGKMHFPIDDHSPDPWVSGSGCDASEQGPDGWCKYNTTKSLQIIIFGRGYAYQEIKDAYAPVNGVIVNQVGCTAGPVSVPSCLHEATMRRGAGGALATKATYMMSIFLYDPNADPNEPPIHEQDYCLLCD